MSSWPAPPKPLKQPMYTPVVAGDRRTDLGVFKTARDAWVAARAERVRMHTQYGDWVDIDVRRIWIAVGQ